jgi:hypothetical protein
MPAQRLRLRPIKFEMGHVLFIDIVGHSKLVLNEQRNLVENPPMNAAGKTGMLTVRLPDILSGVSVFSGVQLRRPHRLKIVFQCTTRVRHNLWLRRKPLSVYSCLPAVAARRRVHSWLAIFGAAVRISSSPECTKIDL